MHETRTDQEARDKVWEMVKDIEVCTMVTVDREGRMRGRPMYAVKQKKFEGTLWFFTAQGTPKTDEIREDERVLLAYADRGSNDYVSISGTAQVHRVVAKQKEYWSEFLTVWFPGGPEDPKAALLKVTVEGAEYWDSPSSTLLHAYGYVKARLTGESPKGGENEKVSFGRPTP